MGAVAQKKEKTQQSPGISLNSIIKTLLERAAARNEAMKDLRNWDKNAVVRLPNK